MRICFSFKNVNWLNCCFFKIVTLWLKTWDITYQLTIRRNLFTSVTNSGSLFKADTCKAEPVTFWVKKPCVGSLKSDTPTQHCAELTLVAMKMSRWAIAWNVSDVVALILAIPLVAIDSFHCNWSAIFNWVHRRISFGFGTTSFTRWKMQVSLMLQRTKWPILFRILTQGFDCCSDTAIGFHKVQPEQMYLFEYLIYHVNPYGSAQVRHHLQSTPAPPPDASLKVVGTFFQSFELPWPQRSAWSVWLSRTAICQKYYVMADKRLEIALSCCRYATG